MGTSPFQTSGNVGDIAPVSLKGGFTPATGVADALLNVANTVIPLITKNLEDDITDDVTGKITAVSEALRATRFPSIQKSMFSAEALANPNVKLAFKEFILIQEAVSANRLPSNFALERLEIIQNNAIRRSPEFEAEIRGAMSDATGQDPTKTLFSRSISTATKRQSAQEKLDEQLFIGAGKLGITVEAFIGINQVAAQNQIQQQALDLSAKQGTYTINTLGQEVTNRGSVIVTSIMNKMMELNVAGTPITPEVENEFIAMINGAFGNASAALQAKIQGLNISGTAIVATLKPLQEDKENALAMVKDGTLAKLLNQSSDVIVADAQNTWLNNPVYGKLHAVYGKEGSLKFAEFNAKVGNNPSAERLLKIINQDASGLYKVNEILQQGTKIGDGDNNLSQAQVMARVLAATHVVGNTDAGEDNQMAALEDINKYKGREVAWSIFGNRDMPNAVAKSTRLKAAFLNMQVATTAGLSGDLVDLANNPNVEMERMVLTEAGLVVTPRSQAERVGLSAIDADADASMATYVRRWNRADVISARYNGAGLLPSIRYSGSQMYWNKTREAASELVAPVNTIEEDSTVIKWGRDEQGKPIRLVDGGT
jgi:hypothetical protein